VATPEIATSEFNHLADLLLNLAGPVLAATACLFQSRGPSSFNEWISQHGCFTVTG